MIDLSSYNSLETALFIKWTIPSLSVKYFSDYHTDVTIDGNVYSNNGAFLGISDIQEQIKASAAQITIALSGLTPNLRDEMNTADIKGSEIQIYRGFFDSGTHALLDLTPDDNPMSKFKGIVTNVNIVDRHNATTGVGSSEISITCNSAVEILQNQLSGRRTNPRDFESEKSMDRVPILSQKYIHLGGNK